MTLQRRSLRSAPAVLNTADKAVWVTGWNEAVDALEAEQAQAFAVHGFKASRSENGAVFLEPTSIRRNRTAQEFKFGMEVLNWNRAQQEPPIDVGRELWVADEVFKMQAQAVEPFGWVMASAIDGIKHWQIVEVSRNKEDFDDTPLYLHPAPPATGERAALIARLRDIFKNEWGGDAVREAADMLEADSKAQQVAVPMLADSILKAARECKDIYSLISIKEMVQFTRAIEAHHGIGEKS